MTCVYILQSGLQKQESINFDFVKTIVLFCGAESLLRTEPTLFFISTDFLKLQLTESVLICFGLVKNYRGALEDDRGGLFSLSQVLFTGPV